MVVVGASPGGRTYIEAVNRIIGDIGESLVGTLLSPSQRVMAAMRAVEDARDECYYRTMWKFRRGMFAIDLVALQMWYELPADYHKLATFISRNTTDGQIWFKTYDELLLLYPNMRIFVPGAGVPVSPSQAASQTNTIGTPVCCTDHAGYLGLMPVPDSAFVALEGRLYAHYWKHAAGLVGEMDDIGLPRELWQAHHHLALSKLKKVVEYADWEADRNIGMRQLYEAASAHGDPMDSNINDTQGINYNE